MELCFYRGHDLSSAFIRWWTASKYSHVELRFADGRHWSALMGHGSRWLSPSQPDLVVPIDCLGWEEELLVGWCEKESGCPYDWLGLFLAQFLNRARSTKDAWFCSEACTGALISIGKLPDWLLPCTVSPGTLERISQELRRPA